MTARRITTEGEAKAALAERRRKAREELERQAELERQRYWFYLLTSNTRMKSRSILLTWFYSILGNFVNAFLTTAE